MGQILISQSRFFSLTLRSYDPYEYYPISYEELYHCGKDQGIDIRPASQGGDIRIGDILFVRTGFVERYHNASQEERNTMALRPHALGKDDGQRYAGLSQEERILDWLHDSYFAAVAGDAPAFEAWPSHEGKYRKGWHVLGGSQTDRYRIPSP